MKIFNKHQTFNLNRNFNKNINYKRLSKLKVWLHPPRQKRSFGTVPYSLESRFRKKRLRLHLSVDG